MSKSEMGFKPQMNPKYTSQPPKVRFKLDICCHIQWETQGKTCGRWLSPSTLHGEHLFMSSFPETPKTCHIPRGAQQPRTMGS